MTGKSKKSSIAKSLKKGAKSLLSGKKDLAKLASALPLTALLVEEVRAAQKSKQNQSAIDDLKRLSEQDLSSANEGSQQNQIDLDKSTSVENSTQEDQVSQATQEARDALRAVLEDELANAETLAREANPTSPEEFKQAIRATLNEEVGVQVAKASAISSEVAEALAKLPELPQLPIFPNFAGGFNPSFLLGFGLAGIGPSAGGVVANATGLKVAGFVIDGYVSGATVFADINGNFSWDDGEPYALTDDTGHYAFTTRVDLTNINIVSLGGVDTSTLSPIQMMVGKLGYDYITPVSTVYSKFGEGALIAAGLDKATLSYDPMAQVLNVNPVFAQQAAQTLLIGQQLLVTLNSTVTLIATLANPGLDQTDTSSSAFKKAYAEAYDSFFKVINGLLSKENSGLTYSELVDGLLDNPADLIKQTLASSKYNLDVSSGSGFGALIDNVSGTVSYINNKIASFGLADVLAGTNNAWAAVGQTNLTLEVKSLASQYVPGSTDASTFFQKLNESFASSALEKIVAAQQVRLQFNKADNSGITTKALSTSIDAPKGDDASEQWIDLGKQYSASTGTLSIKGVALLDKLTQRMDVVSVEPLVGQPNQYRLSLKNEPQASGSDAFKDLQLTAVASDGTVVALDILGYQSAQAGGSAYLSVSSASGLAITSLLGNSFAALISKPIPEGISLKLDSSGRVGVVNELVDGDSAFGQLDFGYLVERKVAATSTTVAQDTSRIGLFTVYVQPQAPNLDLPKEALVFDE